MRRGGRLLVVVSLIAGLMAVAGPAQAEELEYVATGMVIFVPGGDLSDEFAGGDEVIVSYSVDLETPDSLDGDDQVGEYPGALTSFEMTIGDYSVVADLLPDSNGVDVRNGSVDDFFVDVFYNLVGSEVNGYVPGGAGFALRDGDGTSLADDSLDQPIAALQRLVSNDAGEFAPDGGHLSFHKDRGIQFLEFSIDSIEVEVDDSDGDGVPDENDVCPGTIIPDPVIPISGELGTNRYALVDTDTIFDTSTAENQEIVYTITDTGGCNATQIADAVELGKSHYEKGITRSVVESWIASLSD